MQGCNIWDVEKLLLRKFLVTVTCVSDFPFCCVQVGNRIPYLNFHILQIRKAAFRGVVVLVVLEGTSDIYWQTLVIFCHFSNFDHFWQFYMHKSFNGKSRQVKCNPTSKKSSEILPCMANSTIMYVVGLCSKRKKERVCEYLECLFVGEPWLELLADHVLCQPLFRYQQYKLFSKFSEDVYN